LDGISHLVAEAGAVAATNGTKTMEINMFTGEEYEACAWVVVMLRRYEIVVMRAKRKQNGAFVVGYDTDQ
jgi:hypothetical protein